MNKLQSDLKYLLSLNRGSSFGGPKDSYFHKINKSRPRYLIFTDCGEEIDDEVALYYLYQIPDVDLVIVFVGTNKSIIDYKNEKSLADQEGSRQAWKNFGINPLCDSTRTFLFTLSDFAKNGPKGHYDLVLQIAPMHGYTGEGITYNKYILLGSYNDSVNKAKTHLPDMSDSAKENGKLVEVKSEIAALMRPTSALLNKLPDKLKNEVLEVGFKLIVKRANPKLGFAEGLINIDLGRGANYTSIENLYGGDLSQVVPKEAAIQKAMEYANQLTQTLPMVDKNKNPKDGLRSGTIKKLSQMYQAISDAGIDVPILDDSTYPGYRESSDGKKAFAIFNKIALKNPMVLNPVYDLFGAYIAHTGSNPNTETFESFNKNIF